MDERTDSLPASDPQTSKGKPMTIGEAKRFFEQFRKSLEPDYASVMQVLRALSATAPIANSNYLHFLNLTDLMFRNTNRSLRMLTGNACEAVPSALYDSFKTMLSRIKENRGSAQVIVVNGNARSLDQFQDEYKGTLFVTEGKTPPCARVTHFMVCDSDMVRDEEYHPELSDDTSADLVRAKIYFANSTKADSLTRVFDRVWSSLTAQAS